MRHFVGQPNLVDGYFWYGWLEVTPKLNLQFKPSNVYAMRKLFSIPSTWWALIAIFAAVLPARADSPRLAPELQAEQRAELQQRIQELDSACYETRSLAAAQVERWLGMPEMAAMLAEQFQQLFVQPE